MVLAAILVVGDEILEGHTQDTNSHYLAQRLRSRGIRLGRVVACGDDVDDISAQIERLARDGFSPIFVTGGIGPTPDDRTYEAVAMAAGVPLVVTTQDEAWMRRRSQERGYAPELLADDALAEPLRRMVRRPEGSDVVLNPFGMALGSRVRIAASDVFVLPGVPREMRAMVEQEIEPRFFGDAKPQAGLLELEYVGQEARLYSLMRDVEARCPGVRLGSYPQDDRHRIILRLQGPPETVESARRIIVDALPAVRARTSVI